MFTHVFLRAAAYLTKKPSAAPSVPTWLTLQSRLIAVASQGISQCGGPAVTSERFSSVEECFVCSYWCLLACRLFSVINVVTLTDTSFG